jgi:hypothetical protein
MKTEHSSRIDLLRSPGACTISAIYCQYIANMTIDWDPWLPSRVWWCHSTPLGPTKILHKKKSKKNKACWSYIRLNMVGPQRPAIWRTTAYRRIGNILAIRQYVAIWQYIANILAIYCHFEKPEPQPPESNQTSLSNVLASYSVSLELRAFSYDIPFTSLSSPSSLCQLFSGAQATLLPESQKDQCVLIVLCCRWATTVAHSSSLILLVRSCITLLNMPLRSPILWLAITRAAASIKSVIVVKV